MKRNDYPPELVSCRSAFHVAVLICAMLVLVPPAQAQEAEGGEEVEYKHAVSVFLGAATHMDEDDTGGAIGLSYAYLFAPKWAVGVKGEYVSSDLERDTVFMAGFAFEPVEHLELAALVGAERSETDETEHGETHQVDETEALLRLGVAFMFPLNPRVALSPEFNTDFTATRLTIVYGLVLSVGL